MVDEENFIVGAKKTKAIIFEKNDFETCVKNFQSNFIDEIDIDNLIRSCYIGDVDNMYIRPTLWKMFLGSIPTNQVYNQWVEEVTRERNIFKNKLKTYNNLKKISGDPLGGAVVQKDVILSLIQEGWNSFFKDNELKKLITLDINRTYQDKELFQNNTIKDMLTSILFVWSKDNIDVSYRQGMNELLAVLLLALHPFYFNKSKQIDAAKLKENIKVYQESNNNASLANDLYIYLYHESELQADLYILFNSIMNRGILNLYSVANDEKVKKDTFAGKKKDLFHLQYQDETPLKLENSQSASNDVTPLQKRCNKIYKEYLKIIDRDLYDYMINIDIDATIILVRWLKCILNREFHHGNVISIWDTIFAFDVRENMDNNPNIEKNNLNMLDYICVAMLTFIRDDILNKDNVECLQRLFKYPPVETPIVLIKMALNIKELIYKKVFKVKEKKLAKPKHTGKDTNSSSSTSVDDNRHIQENKNKIQSKTTNVENKNVEKLRAIIEKYQSQIEEKDLKEITELLKII